MARRRRRSGGARKKIDEANAAINFRPGIDLGLAIGTLADKWCISRGETCKRIVTLAVRDMPLEFYGVVDELRGCMFGDAAFEEAAAVIHVAIERKESEQLSKTPQPMDNTSKLFVARETLSNYRQLHGLQEDVETKAGRIHIRLTESDS